MIPEEYLGVVPNLSTGTEIERKVQVLGQLATHVVRLVLRENSAGDLIEEHSRRQKVFNNITKRALETSESKGGSPRKLGKCAV